MPGKSLVVYEPTHGLVRDVFLCEDGHAQERSLFGAVLDDRAAQVICGSPIATSVPGSFCVRSTRGARFHHPPA